jgi:cellulose synthase/poly-beta-1,6-N-acetylglucosamine synthase-like glycosyltransferase
VWESRAGNAISATGAIYAIRRSLFQGVPVGVTDDFAVSTSVIAQGRRLVFEPDAVAYEWAAKSHKHEFARKVRIMTRGLAGVMLRAELLNPFRFGFYSLQLFTHKLLRRLLFIPLVVIFLSNLVLLSEGWFYGLTALAQAVFYAVALAGAFLIGRGHRLPKPVAMATYACMVYAAAAVATWNILRGHRIVSWTTDQRAGGA